MLLSYHASFAPAVATGAKLCTIRTRSPKIGETLHHFTGPYRPGERRRLAVTLCTAVQPIEITSGRVTLDGRPLPPAAIATLARADGFPDPAAFHAYFAAAPFRGYLISWTHERPPHPPRSPLAPNPARPAGARARA